MRPYRTEIERIKALALGKAYGATEGIFDYMAAALGMRNATPAGFQRTSANDAEPAPGDLHEFEEALTHGAMSVLMFNTQTEGAIPDQLRDVADAARVPVVNVTESVPPSYDSFEGWQVSQLRDLATALADMTDAFTLSDVSAARGPNPIWSQGTFSIASGSIVAVIGPNGSGKTTLLEMILGLIPVASGQLRVLGEEPRRGQLPHRLRPAELRRGGRRRPPVPRPGGPGPDRNAVGSRSPFTRRPGAGRRRARGGGCAGTSPRRRLSQLSGGQQQRVAIAQALVGEPDLLLLDEPLANLDVRNQHEIVELLAQLRAERDVTILVVVHDLNPLLSILTGAIYLLDGHAHYGAIGDVVDSDLLTHLYDTPIRVVRTAQGDLFTRERNMNVLVLLADVGYQPNWLDVLRSDFMRNAFVGGSAGRHRVRAHRLLRGAASDAFAAHALAHIGFPGATFAILVGIPVTLGLAAVLRRAAPWPSARSASGSAPVRCRPARSSRLRPVSASSSPPWPPRTPAPSRACCSATSSRSRTSQIRVFPAFTLLLAVVLAVVGRPLLFASVDPQVAEAEGVAGTGARDPVHGAARRWPSSMAVQVVGTLLLFALVVTPAATALAITARPPVVVFARHGDRARVRLDRARDRRRCSTCRRASAS